MKKENQKIDSNNKLQMYVHKFEESSLVFPVGKDSKKLVGELDLKPSRIHLGGFILGNNKLGEGVVTRTIESAERISHSSTVQDLKNLSLAECKAATEKYWVSYKMHAEYTSATLVKFSICLYLASEKIQKGEKLSWYKQLSLSDRSAQKYLSVGKKFLDLPHANVGAYNPSQILRLSSLKTDLLQLILKNDISGLTVKKIEKLKKIESKVDPQDVAVSLSTIKKLGSDNPELSWLDEEDKPKASSTPAKNNQLSSGKTLKSSLSTEIISKIHQISTHLKSVKVLGNELTTATYDAKQIDFTTFRKSLDDIASLIKEITAVNKSIKKRVSSSIKEDK